LEKVAETISFLRQPGESFLLLLTGNNHSIENDYLLLIDCS